jgi:hypothetical protein
LSVNPKREAENIKKGPADKNWVLYIKVLSIAIQWFHDGWRIICLCSRGYSRAGPGQTSRKRLFC